MNGDQLDQLTEGLCSNGLEDYDYLLTGYIGSESFLIRVLHLLQSIESSNPNARYFFDPFVHTQLTRQSLTLRLQICLRSCSWRQWEILCTKGTRSSLH